jgi:hypothetical protein
VSKPLNLEDEGITENNDQLVTPEERVPPAPLALPPLPITPSETTSIPGHSDEDYMDESEDAP